MSNVSKIPLIGELIPISVSGSVTDSKYIRGGYIVCQTMEELNALLSTSLYPEHDVITDGTPVYVASTQKTYRYREDPGAFVEDSYYNTSITDLQMQNVYSNISCVSRDVTNLSNRTAELTIAVNNNTVRIAGLAGDVSNLTTRTNNLSAGLANVSQDVRELTADFNNLSSDFDNLSSAFINTSNVVNNLSTDVTGLIYTTENLSSDLSNLSDTVDNISDHLGNLSELTVIGDTTLNNVSVSGETTLNGFTSNSDSEVYGNFAVRKNGDVGGNVTIEGDLTVLGNTTSQEQQTLKVKDNFILTNADKATLISLSGLGINVDADNTYGIAYDPGSQSVKIGLGSVDENNSFTFNEGEGAPIAARADSSDLTNGHLMQWDADQYKLVDSNLASDNIVEISKMHGSYTVIDTSVITEDVANNTININSHQELVVLDQLNRSTVYDNALDFGNMIPGVTIVNSALALLNAN